MRLYFSPPRYVNIFRRRVKEERKKFQKIKVLLMMEHLVTILNLIQSGIIIFLSYLKFDLIKTVMLFS